MELVRTVKGLINSPTSLLSPDTMNCFIYCRKSLEDKTRQVQSIDDQMKVMQEQAQTRNLTITKIFTDEKSAGRPYQRVGFQEMMKQLHKGETQVILTWKIDRLSRNPIENGQLSWMLQQGIIKEIVTSDRSYLPEDNVLLFMVEGAMANQYLRDLSKNVKRGMQSRVEKGVFPALAPLGYLNKGINKGQKMIIPDPVYFSTLQELWKLMSTGNYQLADLYRIMQDKYPIYKKGKLLAFSSFHRIFHNPFYCGLFKWDGKQHLGTHKPMLTQSEFENIQKHLGKKQKTREKHLEFDFKGIFKCGNCNACITAERKKKFVKAENTIKAFDYYRCTRRKRDIVCKEKPLSKKQIETQLKEEIGKVLLPNKVLDFGIEKLNEADHFELEIQSKHIQVIEKEIRELLKRIEKIEDNLALESNADIREIMRQKHMETKIKIQRLHEDMKTKKDEAGKRNQQIIETLRILQNGEKLLLEGTREQKKRLFHSIGLDISIEEEFKLFANKEISIPEMKFDFDKIIVEPPKSKLVEEPISTYNISPIKINYLEQEQKNQKLGQIGEEIVFEFEKWNLLRIGKEKLVDKVEWISKEQGDGAGFDILSKYPNGKDKYIEVKSTKLSKEAPFFFTRNELQFSKDYSNNFHLYRVFNIEEQVKMFIKIGALNSICRSIPMTYKGFF